MLTLTSTSPSQAPSRVSIQCLNISWKQEEKKRRSRTVVVSGCLDISTWVDNSTTLLPVKIAWALHRLCFHRNSWENLISKIAQEATADSILFASSPQPVPLRHHFPFLETWPLIQPIYIFCLSVPSFPVALLPSQNLVWWLLDIRGTPAVSKLRLQLRLSYMAKISYPDFFMTESQHRVYGLSKKIISYSAWFQFRLKRLHDCRWTELSKQLQAIS